MSIRSNIESVMDQISQGDTALAEEIKAQAEAAITAGKGSPEWEAYMNRFAESPEELARLLGTDSTESIEHMNTARKTLVDNGTCGATSTGFMINDIGDILDEDL